MEITALNISEIGFDLLQSELDRRDGISVMTRELIQNELKDRQYEMDQYNRLDFNKLSIDVLISLRAKGNRYSAGFSHQVTAALIYKNEQRISDSQDKSKGNLAIIIITGIILLVAFITNPSLEKQREVVKAKILQSDNPLQVDMVFHNDPEKLSNLVSGLFIDKMLENSLSVYNCIFISFTCFTDKDKTEIVGIALFGQVYIPDSEIEKMKNME